MKEGSRFGQRPGGCGKVADLRGIHHRDEESSRGQRRDHGPLAAPSGFKRDERGLHGLESRHEGGDPKVIVGHGPAFARGLQGHSELGFGDVNTNQSLWGRPPHS